MATDILARILSETVYKKKKNESDNWLNYFKQICFKKSSKLAIKADI